MGYQQKKEFFDKVLTIYGRNAVHEALQDTQLAIHKLHLADSNKPAELLRQCELLAAKRGIPVEYHDKRRLSFISKNAQQDQGIALDICLNNLHGLDDLRAHPPKHLLLLDGITNPQNVGMIIRSSAAGFIGGVVIPQKGCADLGPLTIKASAGALFHANIYRCPTALDAVDLLATSHEIIGLALQEAKNLYQEKLDRPAVFVLGNESEGISREIRERCHRFAKIPMNHGVESLNVAVTAALIAFHPALLPG